MPTITLLALALSVLPCLAVAWISYRWTSRGSELIYAVARMVLQLLLIGFALVFIFESDQVLLGAAIIVTMILISALISIRLIKTNRKTAFVRASLSLGLAGSATLAFMLTGVLQLHDPWYQPRLIVPIAGMIFSNAMTAITLAAERFQNETAIGQPYEAARSAAWTTALIPQINALLAVGLVSLPGMMTGQILSGVDPLVAVRYQIVIMAMILQASAFSVAIFLWLYRPRPS
ncbi:MAG: ABC transporter permease [Burkholderiaceae bacterium]